MGDLSLTKQIPFSIHMLHFNVGKFGFVVLDKVENVQQLANSTIKVYTQLTKLACKIKTFIIHSLIYHYKFSSSCGSGIVRLL